MFTKGAYIGNIDLDSIVSLIWDNCPQCVCISKKISSLLVTSECTLIPGVYPVSAGPRDGGAAGGVGGGRRGGGGGLSL